MNAEIRETKPAGPVTVPEERFWKRYSPHGEAPLSFAASVTLHGLAIGAVVLLVVYLATLLLQPARSLPIEPVRFPLGSSGDGRGNGQGPGRLDQREDVGQADDAVGRPNDNLPPRPKLTPADRKMIDENFDPNLARRIAASDNGPAIAQLEADIRRKLMEGARPGKDGGRGGKDRGKGPSTGPGEGNMARDKRIERMLRWHMRFTANSGVEYLAQLRGLGAILGIPVNEGGKTRYWIVRDLHPPAKLLKNEDLSKIQRIYWWDDKPESAVDIMRALGGEAASLRPMPSRFVAFMPEKLEAELYNMEKRYVENVLRVRPFNEDRIDETNFRVVSTARGYRPELVNVTLKR
jgi:hypothetical protein